MTASLILGLVKVNIANEIDILRFETSRNEKSLTVFIPTSPNPTSGFVILLSTDKVQETLISPEDFAKFILTSGVYQPRNGEIPEG